MKRSVVFLMSLFIGCSGIHINCADRYGASTNGVIFVRGMPGDGITFAKATSDTDLKLHRNILDHFYAVHADADDHEEVESLIAFEFPIIEKWVKAEERDTHLFSIFNHGLLIGFTTVAQEKYVQENDKGEKQELERLLLYATAFSTGYEHLTRRCVAFLKNEFKPAKTLSTGCPNKVRGLHDILKKLGAYQDDTHTSEDLTGYTLDLETFVMEKEKKE